MSSWKEMVSSQVEWLEDNRVRVILTVEGFELGTLYFEKAKVGWTNKPIVQNSWACVDAKVEGLYVYGGDSATPKDVVEYCRELITTQKPEKGVSYNQ